MALGHQLLLLPFVLGDLVSPVQHLLEEGDQVLVVMLNVLVAVQVFIAGAACYMDLVLGNL